MKKNTSAYDIALIGLVAGLYAAFTFVTGPLSFGPGFRIAEGLNFLGFYNKRHIYAITLGVAIVNYYAYGIADIIVGSLSSLIFIWLGVELANFLVDKEIIKNSFNLDPILLKYLILAIFFSLSMISIAIMVVMLGAGWPAFWGIYLNMIVIEFLSMAVGAPIIYALSKRIDLSK